MGMSWSVSRPGRAIPPGVETVAHWTENLQASQLVWMQRKEEKLFASVEDRTRSSSMQSETIMTELYQLHVMHKEYIFLYQASRLISTDTDNKILIFLRNIKLLALQFHTCNM
jgi:hypothetical protein